MINFFKRHTIFNNIEDIKEYNFILTTKAKKGVSALVRCHNEEQKIYQTLKSIYSLFDEIICINNNSSDNTDVIIKDFISNNDINKKIKYYQYPFKLPTIDNNNRNIKSLHSWAYMINYGISKCTYSHIFKWDADMIPIKENKEYFTILFSLLDKNVLWEVAGSTLYKNLNGKFIHFNNDINHEVMIFPNQYDSFFILNKYKTAYFESLNKILAGQPKKLFVKPLFYELKYITESEFAHWDTKEFPTDRKKKEWAYYSAIKNKTYSMIYKEKYTIRKI